MKLGSACLPALRALGASALLRTGALLSLLALLLGTQFVGGEHLHLEDGGDHCPVCVHAQTPAIGAPVDPAPAPPAESAFHHPAAPECAAFELAPRLAASRAPPRA